jgi:hypothetical protein
MAGDGFALRFDSVLYPAANDRLLQAVLAAPASSTRARAGVRAGGGLEVTIDSSGSGTWTVAPGGGIITDTGAGPGSYPFVIPSTVSRALGTRPGGGTSRIDEIVAVIKNVDERPADGAGVREVDIVVITGTAGASPTAPAIPAGQLRLGELLVPAAGAISVSKPPPRTAALGGVIPVASTTERDAISPTYDSLIVYREDNDTFEGRIDGVWTAIGRKLASCHVKRAAALSVPNNNASFALTFDTEVRDTAAMFSPSSTDVTVPVAGRYRITGRVSLTTTTSGLFVVIVAVNGTDTAAVYRGSSSAASVQPQLGGGTTELDLAGGDVITLKAFQNTGGAVNTATGIYAAELIVNLVP